MKVLVGAGLDSEESEGVLRAGRGARLRVELPRDHVSGLQGELQPLLAFAQRLFRLLALMDVHGDAEPLLDIALLVLERLPANDEPAVHAVECPAKRHLDFEGDALAQGLPSIGPGSARDATAG